jgi:hypothetical protein
MFGLKEKYSMATKIDGSRKEGEIEHIPRA